MRGTRKHLSRILAEASRPTVGAVLDAVEVVRDIEDEKEKKAELHKLEKKLGWKLGKMIPVIGPAIGAVKDIGDIYKVVKKDSAKKPEKIDDPILDLFQVDPQYKQMLDDSVEFDFDNDMLTYLGTLSRDEPLPDMTKELEKWIRKKFGREIAGADVTETLNKRSETLLKQIIREIMDPPSEGTPDQILGTPGSDADMPTEKKAALGFINNMMGTSPAADQLDGMGSDIQDYANKYGISSASLKDQLSQILPSSGEHPDFQVDDASGSVSSADGKKVYGEGNMRVIKRQLRKAIREASKSTIKYNADPALKGDQTKLPDALQKGIIDKSLDEDDTPHEPQYDAPQGSKRDKQLDATKADLKSGDPERVERAYKRRERMERQEREKNESLLRAFIEEMLEEELSKKTKATLKKKAEERGLTPGSVYKEFEKGLAAWATSGSRKGMSQHQWAHARVNSATPSKDWAVVKKSKAKKKK